MLAKLEKAFRNSEPHWRLGIEVSDRGFLARSNLKDNIRPAVKLVENLLSEDVCLTAIQ